LLAKEIIREEATKQMEKARKIIENRYNLGSREVFFAKGQEVFHRNFKQSCFQTGYNAKLGPSFFKARLRKKFGRSYFELEVPQGRRIGNYHAKDIRQ